MEQLVAHLPAFVAAYSILFLAAASPGPAVAFLLGLSTSQGRGPALIATTGIACGSLCLNIATLLGVGLLIAQAAWAMQILRLIGAAYLLWLAWGAARKALNPPTVAPTVATQQSVAKHFAAGFLLQVTNPKAIVFWLAIASVGATKGGGAPVITAFVVGAFCISFLCHAAWAVLLSARPVRAAYQRGRRWVEAALGGFFTFAAWRLATSEG
ncbi:LysE family translocator [Puniceibacterium sp. IMCC21224]|uniref:LysE family translocator n=1 Tax=Puniceibacterium sp. IMCC21224 TaxID=1618204 RepID=UPI00064D8882|nr:LysE family translocator [Puniceibacterium sp. IMCC21224]KMK66264.1 putative threonine efflux protein [Puniceibacterium sp. IMCC21224]